MTEKTAYLAEEARWLLSFGTHPLNIADQLNSKPRRFFDLAQKYGFGDIEEAFRPNRTGVVS